jgi:hypothetical protein
LAVIRQMVPPRVRGARVIDYQIERGERSAELILPDAEFIDSIA